MAPQHLLRTLDLVAVQRGERSRSVSVVLGHLRSMISETIRDTTDNPTTPSLGDDVLSLSELCTQLHVTAQTIYDLRSQGRGPRGFRLGRELRFRKREIDAWLSRLESEDDQHHYPGRR